MNLANGETNKFFRLNNNEDGYYVDDFNVENDSYNNYVAILSEEIPSRTVVLDIGCAQGKFGYSLSKKNCTIYGIELNQISAEHAINSGYYKDVFKFDISLLKGNEYERFLSVVEKVDVIIIADVLEHLANPTAILYTFSDILKDNGIMLISVPNIAHSDIFLNLMNGRFNYNDLGILDNTHLKFFTKMSFIEWIDLFNQSYPNKKLDCEYINSSFYYSDYLLMVREKYKSLFRILEQNSQLNALQLLFKLKKLPINGYPDSLKKALSEKQADVVETLGSVVEGIFTKYSEKIPIMLRSERTWYDYALMNLNEQIGRKSWEISQRDERIEALLKYVSELEAEVKQEGINISTLDSYVKELAAGIAQRDERIEALLKYVAELEAEVKQKGINNSTLDSYAKELAAGIAQRDERVEALLKYVSELEAEVKQKGNNISTLDSYIKELEVGKAQRDERIEVLKKYVSELEDENKRKGTCISDLNILVNELEKKMKTQEQEYAKNKADAKSRIQKLSDDLRSAREIIFKMENSFSWKITRFFRKDR